MFILMSNYDSPIDFSNEALEATDKGWERIANAVQLVRHAIDTAPTSDAASGFETVLEEYRTRFIEAMNDDFNTPIAIARLQDFTREVNSLINSGEEVGRGILEKIDQMYCTLGGDVLGIIPENLSSEGGNTELLDGVIKLLIDMRAEARTRKDFAQSDAIRNRLAEMGVTLEDRADGTIYKLG
jgi:cysteinyl-tRNA synthetase